MKMPEFNETDGRRLRSAISRERIINAVIALIDEDDGVPAAEAIAARAGVGLRSLFRHFGDMDSLYAAVLNQIGQRYQHMLTPYAAADWQGQLREAMARRLDLYCGGLRYRRAADQYRAGSEMMRNGRIAMDQMLRARLESVVPAALQADRIWFEQLDLWLSLDSYARLRDRQGMDHDGAAAIISTAVEALIAARS